MFVRSSKEANFSRLRLSHNSYKMILQYFVLNVFLITIVTQAAVADQEPPVFEYCPNDLVKDDITVCNELRVNWYSPRATDNSGVLPSLTSNRQSGDLFAVPSVSEVLYAAKDEAGNVATCSFRITLKRKECPLYAAPKNGTLACVKIGKDRSCAVMCKSGYDFVFNPPMFYYCVIDQWNFYSLSGLPSESQLPWPDCSNQAKPSSLLPYFYFSGDANDPIVQDAIKTNLISLMTSSLIHPFFCRNIPAQCNKNNTEVYAGAFTDQEPPVFTYCPNDIVVDNATTPELRVYWQEPTATDNSGVAPSITSNRASGDLFAVPGSFEVQYNAKDGAGHEATCSFRITLKRTACPLYAPPKNGALACVKKGRNPVCAVMCRSGFDFDFNPPMLYYCETGKWKFYSLPDLPYKQQLPWPDCSGNANTSVLKFSGFPYFYFSGDANDPNVQDAIKTIFFSLMTSPIIPPILCPAEGCNKDNVEAYAGAFSG